MVDQLSVWARTDSAIHVGSDYCLSKGRVLAPDMHVQDLDSRLMRFVDRAANLSVEASSHLAIPPKIFISLIFSFAHYDSSTTTTTLVVFI